MRRLLLYVFFHAGNGSFFFLYIYPDKRKQAHVNIGNPYQCKACHQVAPPVIEQQFIPRKHQKKQGNVMAETVLAGEEVEKLFCKQLSTLFTSLNAVFARLPEYLFMGNRPGYTRDWQG